MDPSATSIDLADRYRAYVDCLNRRAWDQLGQFVDDTVRHNGRALGVDGYRAMIERDYRDIPDLTYSIDRLVCQAPCLAARLLFDCTPKASFLGLAVNGRRVSFAENVIYKFDGGRIAEVWSIVDKAAIEKQLAT